MSEKVWATFIRPQKVDRTRVASGYNKPTHGKYDRDRAQTRQEYIKTYEQLTINDVGI